MIQSYVHMSRLVRLARVAGGAAVEAGEHAGGAAHGGGVDAAHGAGDGEAGADVGQCVARDPRGRHHRVLGADIEVSTGCLAQSAANLRREDSETCYYKVR